MNQPCLIDKHKLKHSFARASGTYDDFAALQRTVADELMLRSGLNALRGKVMDLGCGTGYLTHKLCELGGYEQLFALDIAVPMLHMAKHRLPAAVQYLCADLEQLPLQDNCIDTLFSSLAMQWCTQLPKTLEDCQRVLKPHGALYFSTFGAGTLNELKAAWAVVDEYQHVNDFYTQAEIEEILLNGGWQNIKLTSQNYECRYASVWSLMRELKGIGAHNVIRGRNQHLTGKQQLQKMIGAYPKINDTQVQATYEVIWVQAEASV